MSLNVVEQMDKQTEANVRGVITQLAVQPADRVESEIIEVKGWCKNAKEFYEKFGEAAACLANAHGGLLILGVEEDDSSLERFRACPYKELNAEMLLRKLNDVTIPPVRGAVHDISEIVVELTGFPSAQAYVVVIPKTEKISGHMTAKGVSKIRVGKECRPNFTAEDDRTQSLVPGTTLGDLSESSITWAMSEHRRHYPRAPIASTTAEEFLLQAGLLIEVAESDKNGPPWLSLATLLLFGTEKAIAKHSGHCETVIKTDAGLTTIRKNIVDSYRELCSSKSSVLPSLLPQLSLEVLKELLMNAYIHRCYRTPSAVMITLRDGMLSIQSPGSLAAGLNVNNLVYCVPVYRNRSLAEGARFVGLCDKVGQGIDVVYHAVLSEGFDFPLFEDDGTSFDVSIPTTGSQEFREFVRKRVQSLGRLEEIVALRTLFAVGNATLTDIASAMQRGSEHAKRVLEEMSKKTMIVSNADGSFELTSVVRNDIENVFRSGQLTLGI
jgi:ATP-dependent DNA helicase RecG